MLLLQPSASAPEVDTYDKVKGGKNIYIGANSETRLLFVYVNYEETLIKIDIATVL